MMAQASSLRQAQDTAWRRSLPRRLIPYEGWSTVGLVALLLLLVAWAMEAARWVPQMPPLSRVVLLALATAFVFSKLRLPGLLLHPLSLVLGAGVVLWQTSRLVPSGGSVDRVRAVWERLDLWLGAARFGTISLDILPFISLLVAILWLTSYGAAWLAFRGRQVWLPAVPGGIVLLVTLNYTLGKLGTYFFLYLLIALVLVARLNHLKQRRSWEASGVHQGDGVALSFVTEGFFFALAALLVVWQLPVVRPETPVRQAWAQFSGPWDSFQSEFNRVFAATSSLKPMPMHTFGDTLPFRGAISLGSQVSLRVASTYPGYWRGKSYDTYTSQGWQSSLLEKDPLPQGGDDLDLESSAPASAKRYLITQRVHVGFDTNLVFASGEPVNVSLASATAHLPPARFLLPIRRSLAFPEGWSVVVSPPGSAYASLPPDLRAVAEQLSRQWVAQQTTLSALVDTLPPDLKAEAISVDGAITQVGPDSSSPPLPPAGRGRNQRDLALVVRRAQPPPLDPLATFTQQRLRVGQDYVVSSLVSSATPEDLRAAGTEYPLWVTDRYLQLPETLPKRVRDLALQLTQEKGNSYDKALAIVGYLHQITYSQDIKPPPFDQDAVDFFLFEQRRGYSDYYASAMAVLLRAVGVPARVAVGYNTGDWDKQNSYFVVREHHAHAWTEAFFPGYGWIEFEPTPGRTPPASSEPPPDELDDLTMSSGVQDLLEDEEPVAGALYSAGPGSRSWPAMPLAPAVLGGMAALGVMATWWTWRRGLSGLDPAACAYEKTCRLARLARMGPRPEQTPAEFGHVLAQRLPWLRPSIEAIVHSYAAARYGGRLPDTTQATSLDTAWRQVRRALLRRLIPRKR